MMEANALVVVFDCSASWVHDGCPGAKQGAREFTETLNAIGVVLRAFLAMQHSNRIAVFGSSAHGSSLIVSEPMDETRREQGAHVVDTAIEGLRKYCISEVCHVLLCGDVMFLTLRGH
jgi:hypothetical protein